MVRAIADEEPPPPGVILFLPSHRLVPASSVLYQQISKADFPYFMHPVLILASATLPNTNNKLVPFLPLIPLNGVRLDEVRHSSSISPSPPISPVSPATPDNSPSYILLDQSWSSDSTYTIATHDTMLFPLAKLAPLSLHTTSQLFIQIDRAWTIESSCLTPYPPRRSWSARGKALPNPLMFLAPESLEWVVALHVQKVAAATSILGTRSSFATTRSGWGSAWTTPNTVSSEATMRSDVGEEEVKNRRVSGLNVKAKEFVPLFPVKAEEVPETEHKEEKCAGVKVAEKFGVVLEKGAEREESPFGHSTDLAVKEVENAEEVTLFKQWEHLAVMPVDELETADDLGPMKQPNAKAIHGKKPFATYRNESRFFRAKLPLFNTMKATPKYENHPVTAPVVKTISLQQEAITKHEDVHSTTVVEELSIAQIQNREEYKPPEQAEDEWGDWSCVHSKWNSKSKNPKKVHWKEMDW